MIKIALVDDRPSMITGLQALLSTHEDFSVVLTANSGEEILETLQKLNMTRFSLNSIPASNFPDVVLMDIRMPGMGGVTATKQIKLLFPQLTILILTTFDDDEFIIDALHYGASGYLLKDIGGKRLIESIYEALSGNLLLTGRVATKLASNIHHTQQHNSDRAIKLEDLGFTERELEIAQQIVLGFNTKEICAKTFLSLGTVKNYTSSIYAKLGINQRSKAIVALREILKK
ncbi:response regulator transcription factor [Waterburya agarophytonicola K14]|uniref:Response regulator transcription factor n=1 Tax=Waterburya agarophytonicola KI4 TaxID=2874699 RepID=A0A964BVF9_9CYAN|nr:response regulator transcription factor [Waterburya agarophytonicola]MCC0178831.1 response regulator transcription factor [Waterburya agarophytonicola KI4]